MKRLRNWICQFDWDVFIGTSLAFIFYIGVISPALTGLPHKVHGQRPGQSDQEYRYVSGAEGNDDALARYTLWLVIFTAILAVSTIGLWIVTAKTLRHAQRDADRQARDMKASISAANAAASAAVAGQRAWIKLSAEMGPIYFEETADRSVRSPGGIILPILYRLDNVGNTPATNVQVIISVEPDIVVNQASSFEKVMADTKRRADTQSKMRVGFTLFPNDPHKSGTNYCVGSDKLAEATRLLGPQPTINFIVALAIRYEFAGGSGKTEQGFLVVAMQPLPPGSPIHPGRLNIDGSKRIVMRHDWADVAE